MHVLSNAVSVDACEQAGIQQSKRLQEARHQLESQGRISRKPRKKKNILMSFPAHSSEGHII